MLVSRMAKNLYVWHGRSGLPQTLQDLHQAGREQGYHLQMDQREGSSPCAAHHMQNSHGMTPILIKVFSLHCKKKRFKNPSAWLHDAYTVISMIHYIAH